MKPERLQLQSNEIRRALFPGADEASSNDSDGLGGLQALNYDDIEPIPLHKTLGDYDIIGMVDENHPLSTPSTSKNPKTSTPLPLANISNTFTPNTTVSDDSPTRKLKTPNDTTTQQNGKKVPRLNRSLNKLPELPGDDASKITKVRTALFTENTHVSPDSFYPKTNNSAIRCHKLAQNAAKKSANRKERLYICGKRRGRKFLGQINAGVRHGIKKIKKGKAKCKKLKVALNLTDNSVVKSYLLGSTAEVGESRPIAREVSPEPPPDPNKRFFKSSRRNAVIKVHENLKIRFGGGKMSVVDARPPKRAKLGQSADKNPKSSDEFSFEVESMVESTEISGIIEKLTHTAEDNVLLSPTSVMCDMASGLAINSPKKGRNLNGLLEKMADADKASDKRLFPVFYKRKAADLGEKKTPTKGAKRFKGVSKDQMLLDAGQKKFGMTQCPECEIVYDQGNPNDEIMHMKYHNGEHELRYNGWKNERVITNDFFDGKIIKIIPSDSKQWWKKVKDVLEIVNRDLGFYEMDLNTTNSQIFFYIKNRRIVGVLVAELRHKGYKLYSGQDDQVDLCSKEAYPIKCGISRIWVAPNQRKSGIATAMMNSMRRNFMFGYFLRNEDIAFSSPTEAGKLFGAHYFKTPNFFIYIN